MHEPVIPIATDQDARRSPVVTRALVLVTVVAHLAALAAAQGDAERAMALVMRFGASRAAFEPWQPLTTMFMHDPGSLWHLAGNMIFLWTFGSAVESRLGHAGFLALYLTGGMVAAGIQLLVSPGPVIGASGAVSAVTGAFIVLFPRARVVVFLFLSLVPIPAMLLVGLYFLLDILGAFGAGRGGIGHAAHLGGTAFGFTVAMVLLATGALPRTDMDLFFLVRQWRRRRQMRAAAAATATSGPRADTVTPVAPVLSAAAAERATRALLDRAGASFAAGRFADARDRLERAITTAPESAAADEARVMLAVIVVRKAPDPARAGTVLASLGARVPQALQPLVDDLRREAAGIA